MIGAGNLHTHPASRLADPADGSDRGPGIPAAARERIFTPFERVLHSTNEGASGTGLGLAIGRDLAQRMGGTLELLDSAAGATFRLRIPAPPAIAIFSETHAA